MCIALFIMLCEHFCIKISFAHNFLIPESLCNFVSNLRLYVKCILQDLMGSKWNSESTYFKMDLRKVLLEVNNLPVSAGDIRDAG